MPKTDTESRLEYGREYFKEYYLKNKDKILGKTKIRYEENKESHKNCMNKKRKRNLNFLDQIKLNYGCQNPECQCNGKFFACELDFHHIGKKNNSVSKLSQSSLEK